MILRNGSENILLLEICLLIVHATKTAEDQHFYNSQSKRCGTTPGFQTDSLLDSLKGGGLMVLMGEKKAWALFLSRPNFNFYMQ